MGTLSSNYPNSNVVEAALNRANSAAHDVAELKLEIGDKATRADVASLQDEISNLGLVVRNGMLCVVYESEG